MNASTNTVTATIGGVGGANSRAIYDPITNMVYVVTANGTVSVINPSTNTVTATISVGS